MRLHQKLVSCFTAFTLLAAPFTALPLPQASAAGTDDGLLLRYAFDDAPGSRTAADSSGGGHTGELAGEAVITASEKGGAVDLSGSEAYVKMPAGILDGLTDLTVSAWVYMDTAKPWASLYSFGNYKDSTNEAFSGLNFAPVNDAAKSSLELFKTGFASNQSLTLEPLPAKSWKHVTTVISGSRHTNSLYVDGVLQGTLTGMNALPGDIVSTYNYIGYAQFPWEHGAGKGLDGKIADFRLYGRALGWEDIRALAGASTAALSVDTAEVSTTAGVAPVLPSTVTLRLADGSTEAVPVQWDSVPADAYATEGTFTVSGTAEGTALPAETRVTVLGELRIVSAEPVRVITAAGSAPVLPSVVTAVYNNGATSVVPVTWAAIEPALYAEPGREFTVKGSLGGTTVEAEAVVTVSGGITESLITWYKFDELNGTTVPDASGHGKNATAVNGPSLTTVKEKAALDFDNTKKQYVQLPAGIMSTLDDFTLATWVYIDSKTGDWTRIFDFGTGVSAGKMFLTTNLRYDMEGSIADATSSAPKAGAWTHVAVTKSGTAYTIYVNGTAAASGTSTKKPSDYGATAYNYIAKSNWTADPYLDGKLRDFRIYNKALPQQEVAGIVTASYSDQEAVTAAKEALSLGDTTQVVSDLELPEGADNGVRVTWTSDKPAILSSAGKVTRPAKNEQDAVVTLTAELSRGGYTDTQTFQVNVLADSIVSVDEVRVTTTKDFPPVLPDKVTVRHYDGHKVELPVTWERLPLDKLSGLGTFQLNGTVFSTAIPAAAQIRVADLVSVDEVQVSTTAGSAPELPAKVTARYSDGTSAELGVTWDEIPAGAYDQSGVFSVQGSAVVQSYDNPLIEQRADPHIMKHTDGYYYFTASVPEYDRIVLRRAKSLQGLAEAEEVTVWQKHASGEMGAHIWAPEIHYIDGKWYIYFAAGSKEEIWKIRPYVLECADANPLTGTWIEKGIIGKPASNTASFTDFSLDATTFEHNGQRYLVWAQKENGPSNLYIAPMSNPWTVSGDQVLISTPDYAWERQVYWVNEAPSVLKRNGKIFISFSASATDDNYAMGLLTAADTSDLLDPASWTKSPEPVLVSSEAAGQYGPGHNSFTVAEDGTTDVLVYHARPYKDIEGDPLYDPNRHTRVKRLAWKPDGTPDFGALAAGKSAGPAVPVTARITVASEAPYTVQTAFNADRLTAGGKLEASVTLADRKGTGGTLLAVMALYNGGGTLVDSAYVPVNLTGTDGDTAKLGLTLPLDVTGHKVKVFVWDGSTPDDSLLKPAAPPAILQP
ncbi:MULTISPECIES: family 43 glycosylhydrolase [Paenibacillus]|uniref:family 43 glycosylhydrolase n=1 Tax=Paenibacillus TaxID=44249 RepID=UPI0029E80537|nr:family 43 glycosylhydrolase [Paenibacillus caseinilyticus]